MWKTLGLTKDFTAELTELCAPVITALGYELVGIDFRPGRGSGRGNGLLRLYIDSYIDGAGGVTVDDCALVSRQISALLDVEEPIQGHYVLEVSSPGLDRPLFRAADYQRFSGNKVRVQLSEPLAGRRKFTGLLKGVRDADVVIETDQDELRLPLALIDKARLVPDL